MPYVDLITEEIELLKKWRKELNKPYREYLEKKKQKGEPVVEGYYVNKILSIIKQKGLLNSVNPLRTEDILNELNIKGNIETDLSGGGGVINDHQLYVVSQRIK